MVKPRIEIFKEAPAGATVFKAFSKHQALRHGSLNQECTIPADAWIDLGIDWGAADAERVQATWQEVSIEISVDGQEIANPKQYTIGPYKMRLECPDHLYEGYAMAVAIYVSPLPVGDHHIVWKKRIERELSDGWNRYPKGKMITFTSVLHVVA